MNAFECKMCIFEGIFAIKAPTQISTESKLQKKKKWLQTAELNFALKFNQIFTGYFVFHCLLSSSYKLVLAKIFRDVAEFLIYLYAFLSLWIYNSFPGEKLWEAEHEKIFINANSELYIAVHYNKDQQFGSQV